MVWDGVACFLGFGLSAVCTLWNEWALLHVYFIEMNVEVSTSVVRWFVGGFLPWVQCSHLANSREHARTAAQEFTRADGTLKFSYTRLTEIDNCCSSYRLPQPSPGGLPPLVSPLPAQGPSGNLPSLGDCIVVGVFCFLCLWLMLLLSRNRFPLNLRLSRWQKGDRPDNDLRWGMQHPDKKKAALLRGA